MVRSYVPPLNDEEQALYANLPKHHGHVTHPRYVPRGSAGDAYLSELRAWCNRGAYSEALWPQWLYEWWHAVGRTGDVPEHAGRGVLERGAASGARPGHELAGSGRDGADRPERPSGVQAAVTA